MRGATPSCEGRHPMAHVHPQPFLSQLPLRGGVQPWEWEGREEGLRKAASLGSQSGCLPLLAGRSELVKGGSPGSGDTVDGMSQKGEAFLYSGLRSALMPWKLSVPIPLSLWAGTGLVCRVWHYQCHIQGTALSRPTAWAGCLPAWILCFLAYRMEVTNHLLPELL